MEDNMKLYIPEIGAVIRLTQDWTFDLYNEDRNSSMMERMGDTRPIAYYRQNKNFGSIPVTVPAGAELKLDRIYIRKGNSEYSSVTFLWMGERTCQKFVEESVRRYDGPYSWVDIPYTSKKPGRAVRFWAKLDDVNKIECEIV